MAKIRVLLVDDNPEFLEAATRFVATESEIEIVGRALSGREAVAKTEALQPDLVLMDYIMPDMNGIEATRAIKANALEPRIVILTLHDLQEYRTEAAAAGADGFIAKADFGRDLLPLITGLFTVNRDGDEGNARMNAKTDAHPVQADPTLPEKTIGLET